MGACPRRLFLFRDGRGFYAAAGKASHDATQRRVPNVSARAGGVAERGPKAELLAKAEGLPGAPGSATEPALEHAEHVM